jgi:hypothetical protein
MKPNFQEMSKAELRHYVLTHRSDEEAFQIYVDKVSSEEGRIKYPPLKSIEDIDNYPDLQQAFQSDPGRQI